MRSWVGPGMLPMGAYVFSADCPDSVLYEAARAKDYLGELVQICRGVDDQVQIMAAIAASLTRGLKVQLSFGGFYTSAKIAWTQHGVWLAGSGMNATLIYLDVNVNDHVIEVGDGSTYCTGNKISDLEISGRSASQTAGSGIHLYSVEDTHINDIEINDCFANGVLSEGTGLRNSAYTYLTDCYIHDAQQSGVRFENQSYGGNIKGCTITGNGAALPASYGGIHCVSNSEHLFTANLFDDNYCIAVYLFGSSWVSVVACEFLNNNRDGIVDVNGMLHNFSTNTFIDCGDSLVNTYAAIRLDGTTDTNASNNEIAARTAGAADPMLAGIIEIGAADRNLFANNVVVNATDAIVSVGADTIVDKNQGHLARGEKRVAVVALTGALQNVIDFAWQNPHSNAILVDKVITDATTPSTLAASMDVGFDADGTGAGTDFFDDVPIDAAGTYDSTIAAHQGQQVAGSLKMVANGGANDWITGMIRDASGAGLVGFTYIYYTGV